MIDRFSSLKNHAEHWIEENEIKDCAVSGLGKGHKGVEIVLFKRTVEDFMKEYPMLETNYCKGWFTPSRYSNHTMYVSMQKK